MPVSLSLPEGEKDILIFPDIAMTVPHYTTMLTIAGSDPSGGAGIQADIKTASALGVYAMSVITAVTAQNTLGVKGFEPVSLPLLEAQLRCVLDDMRPDAVKIGMIPSAPHASLIAGILREYEVTGVVLDPVLVATSGDALSDGDTALTLMQELSPLATVITPNLPETTVLTGLQPASVPEMLQAACELRRRSGARGVLLKGGHSAGRADIIDIYSDPDAADLLMHSRVDTVNTHGTGCTLSSAVASLMALGRQPRAAAAEAVGWLHGAIKAGAEMTVGHGHGPVNHMYKS